MLLGSRQAEDRLGTSRPGRYPMSGLELKAASVLVERILALQDAARYLADPGERAALDDLVTLLGGYPLPLTVVLPVLAAASPSAVLADLRADGELTDPAGVIRRAVEYSHGKLDPALQASLQLLGPLTAVIPNGPGLQGHRDRSARTLVTGR